MTVPHKSNQPGYRRDGGHADLIEAYLDGLLTDEQRRHFEQRIVDEPHLRDELDCQQRVNESLRRQFQPPEKWRIDWTRLANGLRNSGNPAAGAGTVGCVRTDGRATGAVATGRATSAARRSDRHQWSLRNSLALAAAVALCVTGTWFVVDVFHSRSAVPDHISYLPSTHREMHEVFDHMQALNFEPDWLCETPEEFTEAFRQRFGRPLALRGDYGGTGVIGMTYSYTLTPRTMAVLFEIEGVELLVFVDRIESDRQPRLPENVDLSMHRREVGGFVLYEVSQHDQPLALDLFTSPR